MEPTPGDGAGSPDESGHSVATAADGGLAGGFDGHESPDGRVLIYEISTGIAEKTGLDISELPPLYETIDPDALEAFLRCSDRSDTHPERLVEFSYCGYRVVADSNGKIDLHPEPGSSVPGPSIRD